MSKTMYERDLLRDKILDLRKQLDICKRDRDQLIREVELLREDNQFLIETMQAAKLQIGVGDSILYRELYKRGLANE